MKKFDVEITETLQRTVSVEADSRAEAERLVTEAWNNEDYVLDSTDLSVSISKPWVSRSFPRTEKWRFFWFSPVCIRRKPPSARN